MEPKLRGTTLGLIGAAALVAGFAMVPGGQVTSAAAQQIKMKLTTAARNEITHEWIKRMGALVAERSGGRIKSEIYPGGQLGFVPRQIEGLQFGTIEAMSAPPAFFVGIDQRFQLADTPGLFDGMQHAYDSVTDPAVRERFLSLGESKGIKGVSFLVQGPMTLVTKRPVEKFEDLKGLKIRVFASPFQTEPLNRFGASAAPMPLLETLPSLQKGIIDGSMGSISILLAFKYDTVAKDVIYMPYSVVTMMSPVSKRWFDKLPKDLQGVVETAGRDVEKELIGWAKGVVPKQGDAWKARGGALREFSAGDVKRLRELARAATAEVLTSKPELQDLYAVMQDSANRHRK